MKRLPELPASTVAEYWRLVRGLLVSGGMTKAEAAAAAKAYREWMKPAGWTIYNDDPEDSAEGAKDYAAWMRDEREQTASKPVAKQPKQPAKNSDTLPTQEEIEHLPRWARVAFAARCARRVEPMFQHHWPEAPEKHVLAVKNAVVAAEQSATTVSYTSDINGNRAFDAADAASHTKPSYWAAYAATYAASAVAHAHTDANLAAHAARATEAAIIAVSSIRQDFQQALDESRLRQWTDATPVPPSVFGPLWPKGPPGDWPALPKPTQLKLIVQVPDGIDDTTVLSKLKKLSAALARLNIVGGGHGLKLIPPIEYTQDQDKGRADVVREESENPKGRGDARRGR